VKTAANITNLLLSRTTQELCAALNIITNLI